MDKLDLNDPEQRRLFREVLAEAIQEWLDKQYAYFGKWALRGIFAAAFSVLAFAYLSKQGLKGIL